MSGEVFAVALCLIFISVGARAVRAFGASKRTIGARKKEDDEEMGWMQLSQHKFNKSVAKHFFDRAKHIVRGARRDPRAELSCRPNNRTNKINMKMNKNGTEPPIYFVVRLEILFNRIFLFPITFASSALARSENGQEGESEHK